MLWYLRIALSAACLLACILLIVVWVRYFDVRLDRPRSILEVDNFAVYSRRGRMLAMKAPFMETSPSYAVTVTYVIPKRRQVTPYKPGVAQPNMRQGGIRIAIWSRGIWAIQAPCWFLVLIAAVVGAVPWIRWSFSLRTLMIAFTL